jgi:hypothetical protein
LVSGDQLLRFVPGGEADLDRRLQARFAALLLAGGKRDEQTGAYHAEARHNGYPIFSVRF